MIQELGVTSTERDVLADLSIPEGTALEIQVRDGGRAVRWWQGVTADFPGAGAPYFRELSGDKWRVVAEAGTSVYARDVSGQPIS